MVINIFIRGDQNFFDCSRLLQCTLFSPLRENTTYHIDSTEIQELFSKVCISEKTVFNNCPEYQIYRLKDLVFQKNQNHKKSFTSYMCPQSYGLAEQIFQTARIIITKFTKFKNRRTLPTSCKLVVPINPFISKFIFMIDLVFI